MKIRLFVVISVLMLISNTTFVIGQENKDIYSKIDNYLSDGIGNGFSGSVLVAKKGEIIINKGYGLSNREENVAYTENSVFTIGSVTKQFTATAILKLVEFNKLKITDPMKLFFSNLPEDKKDITIHQLLTHSSGFVDVIGDGDFHHILEDLFFKELFSTKLLFTPGEKYRYSNSGYSILAKIIEQVSGQDYESFLNKYLFEPAGMGNTGYLIPSWNDNNVAIGYEKGIRRIGSLIERYKNDGKVSWVLKGNGGINSTLGDMFKWYEALRTNKVLSESFFEILTTPYISENQNGDSFYAYGWAIFNSDRNTKIVSHNGGNGIFFHDFIWLPEEDVIIIYSTNAYSRQFEIAWKIEKMIFNIDYQPEPIKKSPFLFVFEYIRDNFPENSDELFSIIKKNYSVELETSEILNGLGYMMLESEETKEWALELFKINSLLFSEEGNIWDSLGDGYFANGNNKDAEKSYKKALELKTKQDCYWCENSTQMLEMIKNK